MDQKFEDEKKKIILNSYRKHMFQNRDLQENELLMKAGIFWGDHTRIMSNGGYINNYNDSKNTLENGSNFIYDGIDKLYLMLLEMTEYGFTIKEIASYLGANYSEMDKFYKSVKELITKLDDAKKISDKIYIRNIFR